MMTAATIPAAAVAALATFKSFITGFSGVIRRPHGPKGWLCYAPMSRPGGAAGTSHTHAMAKARASAAKAQILERMEREKVKFMRLQFTDILGTIKNVEIPDRQFEEALDGHIMFDGSS